MKSILPTVIFSCLLPCGAIADQTIYRTPEDRIAASAAAVSGTVISITKVADLPKEKAVLMTATVKVQRVVKAHEALPADEVLFRFRVGASGVRFCPPSPELAVGDAGTFCLLYPVDKGFYLSSNDDIIQK